MKAQNSSKHDLHIHDTHINAYLHRPGRSRAAQKRTSTAEECTIPAPAVAKSPSHGHHHSNGVSNGGKSQDLTRAELEALAEEAVTNAQRHEEEAAISRERANTYKQAALDAHSPKKPVDNSPSKDTDVSTSPTKCMDMSSSPAKCTDSSSNDDTRDEGHGERLDMSSDRDVTDDKERKSGSESCTKAEQESRGKEEEEKKRKEREAEEGRKREEEMKVKREREEEERRKEEEKKKEAEVSIRVCFVFFFCAV
jgi:hypothetical protein